MLHYSSVDLLDCYVLLSCTFITLTHIKTSDMILITFRHRFFKGGKVSIRMPEHCIPNINEWIVFDKLDVTEYFVDEDHPYSHWMVSNKCIVYGKHDVHPTIICDILVANTHEPSILSN